ncbi:MAG TPA: class I SAM-dependent methyltransferase [Candidatus Angelobacter sp.]|nr:class I SAM-dependent methyltransferase [Candidatus Angelobacter sp.]
MDIPEQLRWNQRYSESPSSWIEPDTFLTGAYEEFLVNVQPGTALDLAGGAGRNAVWLAERGWRVKLVDISDVALRMAREKFDVVKKGSSSLPKTAPARKGSLKTEIVDLNSISHLGTEEYDLLVVFYFLRRELFPAISRALKPGGTLVYRTYTIDRMEVAGGPSDPKYLLQPNELLHAFPGLRVLRYHEMVEGKAAAELVGLKPH